jgi:transposase
MSTRLVNIDRQTPMFLPPDLRDWVPERHIVHLILEAIERLDLRCFQVNWRGSGSEQYPPGMLLALLVYCYATGRFRSRGIEEATYTDVAVRYICGNTHPDHDTICSFRRKNGELFKEMFVKALAMAAELGALKKVGSISVDGSKIHANASKHAAVSYKRAGEMIEHLQMEVEALTRKAEEADSTPLDDGLSIPEEIGRREERIAKLEKAKAIIEERFEEVRKQKQADYERKMKAREEKKRSGKKPGGRPPRPPADTPAEKDQVNFTDPDSRIMKASNSKAFEQSYNAQAAVDAEGSYLILGQRVTCNGNDKKELEPTVESVDERIRQPNEVLADSGYFSEDAVERIEGHGDLTAYVAVEKTSHGRTLSDLEKHDDPPEPGPDASLTDQMRWRLKTKKGKERYKLRKETVEPVFGIIKEVMGFRQFHLRGHSKVCTEWNLVTLAYNMRRLFKMVGDKPLPEPGWLQNCAF